MSNLLQTELTDICKRHGVTLDALTGVELLALSDCCGRIDGIMREAADILKDCPAYVVRGVPFYELTPCALEWLEMTAAWWPGKSPANLWAMAYASAHAHDFAAFARLRTRKAAALALLKMSVRFLLSHGEIENAVHYAVLRKPVEGWTASTTVTTALWQNEWQSFVDRMEAQDGIGRNEWLWGKSGEREARAYKDLHTFDFLRFMPKHRAAMIARMDAAMSDLARDKKHIRDRLLADRHTVRIAVKVHGKGGRSNG